MDVEKFNARDEEAVKGREYDREIMEQFLKLLSENGRVGQTEDLSRLLLYIDDMSRRFEAVCVELRAVRVQLAQVQDAPHKHALLGRADAVQGGVRQAQERLDGLREQIAQRAADAVERFKRAGVVVLDQAVSKMRIRRTLEAVKENISGSLADTSKSIEKVEALGRELRSAGGHLKNAGRVLSGRPAVRVDGGQERRFQAAVLAPMRMVRKLLTGMYKVTLAVIGSVERLEKAAKAAQEAGKASVRQSLKEKKGAAAFAANGQKRKAPEAVR